MKFDFTNFTAKVSELNRLHKSLLELGDLRWRTQKAEDITRWENAVRAWKEYSVFGEYTKFYFFENNDFLVALASGDAILENTAGVLSAGSLLEKQAMKLWHKILLTLTDQDGRLDIGSRMFCLHSVSYCP